MEKTIFLIWGIGLTLMGLWGSPESIRDPANMGSIVFLAGMTIMAMAALKSD